MSKSGLNDFLVGVIRNEEVSSVLAITKNDLSAFAKLCEDSLKKLSIMNLAHLDASSAEHNFSGSSTPNSRAGCEYIVLPCR